MSVSPRLFDNDNNDDIDDIDHDKVISSVVNDV